MQIICLPFPPAILNPNRRDHWAKKMPVKNSYKTVCASQVKGIKPDESAGTIPLTLVFYPPANRGDLDNMLASMKSGLDGIAEEWAVNDKRFRPITIDIGKPDKTNPRVELTVKTAV